MPERVRRHPWLGCAVGALFGACVVGEVALGFSGFLPIEYMQPVSALYMIPFLFFIGLWARPTGNSANPFLWLWPLLYAIHAALIVAGVPILFTGAWDLLNVLIPVAGYGLLCGTFAHLYNRYALRRLQKAAR